MTDKIAIQNTPFTHLEKRFSENNYTLLLPKIHMGELPAGTMLAVREVSIDSNAKTGRDVYAVDGGRLALTKTALSRVAAAAGITWVSSERTDNRGHPHYCEFTVRGKVTDFDGTVREAIGNKTIDLREDAGGGIPGKDFAAMSGPKQLAGARKFIAEMCASKAMNRAVADILAIPRSYTRQELSKPFVVPKLVPDTNNALARQAVIANMMGASAAMFGATPTAQIVEATFDDVTDEPQHDPDTGELTGTRDTLDSIKESWVKAKEAGMGSDEFQSLCRNATNKSSKSEMTPGDAEAVMDSVDYYIDNMGPQ